MASPHDIGDRVRLRIVGIELQPNMSKRTIKADLQIDGKVVHELPAIDAGQLLKWSKLMVSDVYSGSRAELVVYQRHHGIYSRFASESWLISEIMQSSTKKLTIKIEDKQYTAEIQVLDQTQAAKSFAKGRAKLMQMKQGGGVPDKLTATRRVFESMLRFGNVVAEILPAAKMAFVVCASAWERVEEQHKSNDELEDLTGRLNGMGPLVEEVEKHAQLRPLLRTIEAFLVLIEDVSIFVLERGTKGFGVRVLKSFIDSSDRGRIEELGKRFRKIKDEFDTAISVQTMAIVARAYEQEQLKRLRHAESNGYDPSRGCQDGTRLTVLDDIDRWIQDPHPSPPFIRLSERGAPAIPFFCKRDDPTLRDPLRLINSVAHGLAYKYPPYSKLSLQQTTAPYVWDAYRFAFAFIDPIAASAPHIYLSALALAPQRSEVFRRLSPMFPNVATIIEGDDEVWPSWLKPMAHPMPITSLCVSPNGQRLVTNCTDESKPVRVFDLRMGAFLRTLDHSAASYSGRSMHITISPNSTTIASISEGREVMFWDINTGAVIHSLHIEGSDDEAMSLEAITFSFDGASLYILAQISDVSDSKNQLIIWETGPGEPTKASFLQDLENDTCVNATAFSPDRTHVAVGDTNGRLLIIPRPGLAMVDVVKVEIEYSPGVIVFSPDGSLIATAGDPDSESISSCTVQLWDARTGGAVGGALMGHIGRVHSIAFSVDGSRMVTGSSDCTVRMWDSQTRDPIGGPFRGHWKDVCSVAFSPDSAYIISGSWDSTVLMWDASASSLANSSSTHEPSDTIVATYPLHKAIMEHYTDKVHKPSDNFNSSGHSGWVNSVLFSLDNTRIISGSGDGTVRTWETQTGLAIETLLSVIQEPDYMAQSSDGNFAIAASGTNGAGESCVWNVKTGAQLPIPPDHVYKCALSPDGTRLITGIYSFDASSAGMVVWDSNSGNMIKKLEGIQSHPEFIAFALDGSYMFSHHLPPAWSSYPSSSSNTPSPPELERKIFIWDPSTYDLVGSWGLEDNLEPLAVSPDGSYLISHPYSGPSIFIHDAQTGNEIKDPLVGHTSSASVCCIAFSPDGAWMASGSGDPDNTIQLWDVKMGSPRSSPLVGHLDAVLSVAFSPDGTKLVSGSADKTIRVWDISADGPGVSDRWCDGKEPHWPSNILYFPSHPTHSGWVSHDQKACTLWLPDRYRRPSDHRLIYCISTDPIVRIDFSKFVHGTTWVSVVDKEMLRS
ncbi:unnamed protein product [Rhizoctonia solani]|uniref:Uncharacterized protein n=1 Tax=Rhizoctonia solani TaxID=456999 RepID=A0A8H3B4E3_9AGAM|nr:unnamed protein product [Rhizoctonia solani]